MKIIRLNNSIKVSTIASLLFLYIVIPVSACTVFNKSSENTVLFGNVENESPHYITELHFVPPEESQNNYGHFYFFYNGNIAGGMNDRGLCFDVAALPSHIAVTGKPYSDLMSYLLNKCSTLEEALNFFQSFAWYGHSVNHIMIMDKSGASAIVEVVGSTVYIFWKESYSQSQVMTNYCIADPEIRLGDYPCPRFLKATSMLDTMAITLDNMQNVCYRVHNAYHNALYANIYNPNTLEIDVFNANIFMGQRTKFKMEEEFKKGTHHYILKNNHIFLSQEEITYREYSISDNYPNPFTSTTSIDLTLVSDNEVKIDIYDIFLNRVTETVNNKLAPGEYNFSYNSDNWTSGIYICRINIDGIIVTRKWIKK